MIMEMNIIMYMILLIYIIFHFGNAKGRDRRGASRGEVWGAAVSRLFGTFERV
jgi:hypothetical protein